MFFIWRSGTFHRRRVPETAFWFTISAYCNPFLKTAFWRPLIKTEWLKVQMSEIAATVWFQYYCFLSWCKASRKCFIWEHSILKRVVVFEQWGSKPKRDGHCTNHFSRLIFFSFLTAENFCPIFRFFVYFCMKTSTRRVLFYPKKFFWQVFVF